MSSLLDYWQGIVGFIIGVASLVIGETFVEWYRKWRNKPILMVEPNLVSVDDEGFSVMLTIHNLGKTVLLETKNRLFVNAPQLVVEGRLARMLEDNQIIKEAPWHVVGADPTQTYEPQDIFPLPDVAFVDLANFSFIAGGCGISFLPRHGPALELIGRKDYLTFSDSTTEAKPTHTLRLSFILFLQGKTVYDEALQRRFAFLLEVPNFGGPEPCDFNKAKMTSVPVRREWESLLPFLKSQGISDFEMTPAVPPFPAPR